MEPVLPSRGDPTGAQRITVRQREKAERSRRNPGSAGASVLIVDDDIGTSQTFAHMLRLGGYVAHFALEPTQALNLLKDHQYDLLILDYQLHTTTGLELHSRIRDAGYHVPFVLMSAWLTTEVTLDAMRLGALDVWAYPIDDIVTLVRSVLDQQTARSVERRDNDDLDATIHSASEALSSSAAAKMAWRLLRPRASRTDVRTEGEWAHHEGISLTNLRDSCRSVDLQPIVARDGMRMTRAYSQAEITRRPVKAFLAFGDSRTLDALLAQSGRVPEGLGMFEQFLRQQMFLPQDSPTFAAIAALIAAGDWWARCILATSRLEADSITLETLADGRRVSRASLLGLCRILEIAPDKTLSFARAFRAVVNAVAHNDPIQSFLDVKKEAEAIEPRLSKASPAAIGSGSGLVWRFLDSQRFIREGNPGLLALCRRRSRL